MSILWKNIKVAKGAWTLSILDFFCPFHTFQDVFPEVTGIPKSTVEKYDLLQFHQVKEGNSSQNLTLCLNFKSRHMSEQEIKPMTCLLKNEELNIFIKAIGSPAWLFQHLESLWMF